MLQILCNEFGRSQQSPMEIQRKATLSGETSDKYRLLRKRLTQTPSESQYLVGSIKISQALGQGDFLHVGLSSLAADLPLVGRGSSAFSNPWSSCLLIAKQHPSAFGFARDEKILSAGKNCLLSVYETSPRSQFTLCKGGKEKASLETTLMGAS